ncbi:MAG: gliding motility protein RemB [Flavobacterium sp.]|nr:gliding motility protein RemB [Flavobacterium sp.]
MKKLISGILLLFFGCIQAQSGMKYPIFPDCQHLQNVELQSCFYFKVQEFVYGNFQVPDSLQTKVTRDVIVLFEVTSEGKFVIQYIDSESELLNAEARRVFDLLPTIGPPTYNGQPTYAKYTIRIPIPLQAPVSIDGTPGSVASTGTKKVRPDDVELTEYDSIVSKQFTDPQFKSHLNIPFSHSFYAQFDDEMNQVGSNSHTASKPYSYAEVAKYYDFKAAEDAIAKSASTWLGRKLWNENLVTFQGDDYWFTLNPIFDLQIGKNSPGNVDYTYVNTRGIQFRGGLGSQINFTTTLYESQGRFADYYNRYAESMAPAGGNPAIIPGIGIAKGFKTDAYDFPMAEANLSVTPNKFVNFQLGYGRNFIGDGYRSILHSDGASPHPYFKVNTTFWKIKYTNTYMWMKDVRDPVTVDRTYATKYVASHYLSWNVTKRFNLGFFESVVWSNQNDRGFDANFINPIIFYRAVEFSSSARSGNALLGLTGKYKLDNRFNFYGQFLIDEFSLNDVKDRNKSWKNKFGYQIGAKYFNAFDVKNLLLQLEYNQVRPYVYSHSEPLTNYAHNNQSLGHNWGGNFSEVVAIARYQRGRLFGDAKITIGTRGLDFDTPENQFNYGGNIYKDYDESRPFDTGVEVGQGNKTQIFIADIQGGYLINPATNLKLFASLIYRNFDPMTETASTFKDDTTWFSIGIRSDIFNWYFDY